MSTDHLVPLLKHALARLNDRMTEALAPFGIDGRELAVLMTLGDDDAPLSQQEIAAKLRVDRTTMVALVDGLEEKGLVDRRPHPADRRKNAVEPTPEGRKVLRAARQAGDAAEQAFLSPLSPTTVATLRKALAALDQPAKGGDDG
jgi:DNA-binding MarR family transcriptional regulator